MAVMMSIRASWLRGKLLRDIDHLGGAEDVLPSEPVGALHDCGFADEIDGPIEQGFEFGFELDFFDEAAFGGGLVGDEDVDVAIGAEVVAEDGAEEGEFGNLPALAELGKLVREDAKAGLSLEGDLKGGH